jgi:hypothetical protein
MTDRIYNSMTNLSSEEIPYKIYLDRLLNEFDQKDYEIWIRTEEDYGRFISAGVLKRSNRVANTVRLKGGIHPIDNIFSQVVNTIRENLDLGKEDGNLNSEKLRLD